MSLEFDPGLRDWRGGPTMRPPSRVRTRITLALIAVAVGFLVGLQATGPGAGANRLASESPEDLTRILSDLNAEADRLAQDVSRLRVQLEQYRGSASQEETALEEARKRLADLQVLAGSVAVRGPGILVTVEDPGRRVGWDRLLDTVQELRDGGAEAITVGDVRVVASTWLGPGKGGVVVDGVPVRAPYELRAVGPADGLREALEIPGGPLSVIAALPGVRTAIRVQEDFQLPPLRRKIAFRYARAT